MTEGQELLARYNAKCAEIIRQHPDAAHEELMMWAIQAGFSMGAKEMEGKLLAALVIRGAKAI
jgi:hypothetical protein